MKKILSKALAIVKTLCKHGGLAIESKIIIIKALAVSPRAF